MNISNLYNYFFNPQFFFVNLKRNTKIPRVPKTSRNQLIYKKKKKKKKAKKKKKNPRINNKPKKNSKTSNIFNKCKI